MNYIKDWMIYQRFKHRTMIPRPLYMANLELVRKYAGEGVIVECGVWKGGMLAGMATLHPTKLVYGFDGFKGMPEPHEIDGKAAAQYWTRKDHDNCKADYDSVVSAMPKNVLLYEGEFADFPILWPIFEKISILRLDCDWYASIKTCFNGLYGRVIQGGLVICDDYYTYDGAARAINEFISESGKINPTHPLPRTPIRLREHKGVCYFVKP